MGFSIRVTKNIYFFFMLREKKKKKKRKKKKKKRREDIYKTFSICQYKLDPKISAPGISVQPNLSVKPCIPILVSWIFMLCLVK